MIRSNWITDIEEFIKIREKWDYALKMSKADRPYLLSDLIITWWEVLHSNRKLRIFVIYDENDDILAGFPLYIGRTSLKKGGFRKLSQVGDGFANLTEPFSMIEGGEFLQEFKKGINKLKGWDFAEFRRIKIDFLGISNNFSLGYRYILRYDQNPIILISGNTEEYLKTRGKNLRRNVKRYRKKAEEIGEVSLEKIDTPDLVKSYAKMLIEFSIESRKERGKVSSLGDTRQTEFVIRIAEKFAENKRIDMHILKFGDNVAAITVGWRYGDGYKYILTSYNPVYSSTHPGYILTYELVEWAYKNGDSYFDMFSGGEVFYKRDWCNSFPELFNIQFYNKSLMGVFAMYAMKLEQLLRKIKKKLFNKKKK